MIRTTKIGASSVDLQPYLGLGGPFDKKPTATFTRGKKLTLQ